MIPDQTAKGLPNRKPVFWCSLEMISPFSDKSTSFKERLKGYFTPGVASKRPEVADTGWTI